MIGPIFMVCPPVKATYMMIGLYLRPGNMLEINQNYPVKLPCGKRAAFHALIGKN